MQTPDSTSSQSALESVRKLFRYYHKLGTQAISQVEETALHWEPATDTNSIAIIVGHLSGNMLSRWTDFLESDGEKTWRKRDKEFMDANLDRTALLAQWEKGWACLFEATDALTGADMDRIAYIRNEGHTVMEALHRQLAHYAYHVGQIVFLAKTIKGPDWQSLSIPKGNSQQFNAEKFAQDKGRRHFFTE